MLSVLRAKYGIEDWTVGAAAAAWRRESTLRLQFRLVLSRFLKTVYRVSWYTNFHVSPILWNWIDESIHGVYRFFSTQPITKKAKMNRFTVLESQNRLSTSSDVGVNRGETDHRPRPFLSSLSPSPYRDLLKCRISHVHNCATGCHYSRLTITTLSYRDIVQRWDLFFVNLVKQDPGRARQDR